MMTARTALAALLSGSLLVACGGGGGIGNIIGGLVPTPAPTSAPGSTNIGYSCPSSVNGTSAARMTASLASFGSDAVRRVPAKEQSQPSTFPGLLEVVRSDVGATSSRGTLSTQIAQAGGSVKQRFLFSHLGTSVDLVAVDAARSAAIAAQLRALPGVTKVVPMGLRYTQSVLAPITTNDPYFHGFPGSSAPYFEAGNPAPSPSPGTSLPGQWDMHAISLGHAWAYSNAADAPVGYQVPDAMGNSAVRIAIIDTGADVTHPELQSKIAYTHCFITNINTGVQSSSNYVTDFDGHGTDVAGIAAADVNNSLGFVGAGGNVSLIVERVFPSPPSNCVSQLGSNPQACSTSASTADIASGIDDAVANGAKVVNLSIGASCAGGDDPLEAAAVANALAAGVVVVAASGNSSGTSLDAPACDAGVIAVGASALSDGFPSGTYSSAAPGTPSAPVEYVASYSNYQAGSTTWGLVAPGGDPANVGPGVDDLHWIENIYSSTAMGGATCTPDFEAAAGSQGDCRVLIAGTSQATPHVSGAAALLLSVKPNLTPTQVRNYLCTDAYVLPSVSAAAQGCGRLDIYRAMADALGDPNLPTAQ